MFTLIIPGNTSDHRSTDKNHTCPPKDVSLPRNDTDYGQVFVIFRIKKELAELDNIVAIVFEGGSVQSNGGGSILKLFEKTPGSGKWIAVTMMPTNQLLEFKGAVVNAADDIVECENGGKTRQIRLRKTHICISLPWGKTDTVHYQRRLPKNLGIHSTFFFLFLLAL